MINYLLKLLKLVKSKLYSFLRFIHFYFIPKNKWLLALLIIVITSSFFVGVYAFAEDGSLVDELISFLNALLFLIASALGWIAMKIFGVILAISTYNQFVDSAAVNKGWVLVRDFCNMAFVVILLVIAFAQILRIQNYSLKTLLPKVLIAAVLVNFSKLICGLIIDAAQVVMMTFVNGYMGAAGANLVVGLGLTKLLQFNEDAARATAGAKKNVVASGDIFVALVLAIFILIGTIFVTFFIALLLIMRIVVLWILVVLSPAAFLLSAVPFGKSYAGRWWNKFGWYVAVGPLMAFFLWLSLLVMSNPEEMIGSVKNVEKDVDSAVGTAVLNVLQLGNITQAAIGLALLMGSLMVVQEAGGMAGSLAQKGFQ
ncbi:MAG: hypothetical protein ABH859_08775, partial [Pseudomonadota bacterium]